MSWERLCSKLTTLGFPPPPAPGPYQLSGAQLPSTVAAHFVTQDFVGRSIQTGKLLEEAAHALPVVSEYQHRCRELLEHPLPQSLPRSAAAAEAAAASAAPHAPPSVALTRFGGAQAPAGEELAPEAAGAPEQQSVFSPSLPIRSVLQSSHRRACSILPSMVAMYALCLHNSRIAAHKLWPHNQAT